MNALLHPIVVLSLTSFPLAVVCLNPVPVQCSSPLLVASGTNAVFTVQTVPNVPLIRWTDSAATTLAMWVNGGPVLMSVQQFQGRITVSATQFTVSSSQISDSGNYSVSVEPSSTSGLSVNTCSVQLKVFDAVSGVSLSLPSLPLEGGNVSVSCSWTAGSQVSVVWGKAGAPLSSDSHIGISSGSLLIISASRQDSGQYSCTVSNPVSAQTAKGNLNIYYGPDSPQLTKSSSQCVGGGDATVGQSVLLSCTSASLPPASFTWQINGQTVSSSQSANGLLTLQIFSTNQSGGYVCTAHNGITGGTSSQQINLAIVGTCLSAGAVAGIVVACVVALIIIIVVIIVLLRQRNVDRRVRNNIELQKTNPNEGMTIANRALVNENHPTLHSSLPQNVTNHNNGNISTMAQNIPRNSLHHNGHMNTDEFQHNFSAVPDNGHQINNNSTNPNNDPPSSFPQHTPNIVIQTGNSQPGALAPTVHVSLNALPHTDQFNTQPQTVHVNLNTYPPEAQQTAWQHADQRESALHSQHTNAISPHTGLQNSNQHNNLIQANQTNAIRQPTNSGLSTSHRNHSQSALQNSISGNPTLNNASTNGSHHTDSLIQTGYSHHSNQTNANRRNANLQSTREEQTRRSNRYRTNNQFDHTNLQQIPWDRLRGTPAYPNQEVESSDSSESSDWMPRPPQQDRRGRSAQRQHEPELSSRSTQPASSPQRRDLQRPTMHNQSQMEPNLWSQVVEQMQVQSQRHALPQTESSQGPNPIPIGQPRGTTIPQTHPQRHHEPGFSSRSAQAASSPQRRDLQRPIIHNQSQMDPNLFSQVHSQIPRHALPQTETSQGQNPMPIGQSWGTTISQTHPQAQTTTRTQEVSAQPVVSLTEAALRQHTTQTNNTFANRNQQTQAALQNPGPPQPIPQVNKAGKRAPTPPPVLQPAEFQTLPRERTQKVQPVRVQHRHRSPNAHRQTHIRHISPQRMPGMHHMHGHPMHMQQVHRGRPRR